jgi:cell shape-determining protein MreD
MKGLLLWLIMTCFAFPCYADNVGITTARLIETSVGTYTLEVDTSPMMLSAFAAPVLPERFKDSLTTEFEKQAQFVLIKYRFSFPEQGLTAIDELLLPWGQMGVSLTAQWNDGTFQQSLFLRRLDGIPVPIRLLRSVDVSLTGVMKQAFRSGLLAAIWSLNSWLLITCLACMLHRPRRISVLSAVLAGFLGSLLLADIGGPRLPSAILQSLFALVLVLLARSLIKNEDRIARACRLVGVATLLAGYLACTDNTVAASQQLAAGLMFQWGWASVVLLLAFGFAPLLRTSRERRQNLYVIGILAVAVTIGHFMQGIHPPLESSQRLLERVTAAQVALPGAPDSSGMPGTGGYRAQPKTRLDDPLAAFMTLEPYETRLEMLVKVSETEGWPGCESGFDGVLPVEAQEAYRRALTELLSKHVSLTQDGTVLRPVLTRSDFVTMGPYGIFTRPEPIPESIPEAILGVTLVYHHAGLPREAGVAWTFFADNLSSFRFTIADPFGGRQTRIDRETPNWLWKNRLAGYRPPEVKPVALVVPEWPVLSLCLLGIAGGLLRRSASPASRGKTAVLLLLAYGAYPFARTPITWGASGVLKPTRAEAVVLMDNLLTNVYRSFDFRQEEAVYDRLALTVAGDQLVDIYLQSRRALELENRGGARGHVDEVEVMRVQSVTRDTEGGYVVHLAWKVSGSVSHFGHTHYRQNMNRAEVTIRPVDRTWRITGMNVIDEERLL